METLATLTMDIDVRSADPAESKLRALTQAAKGAEDQFIRASSAARAQATSHDLSASAASQAAKSLDGLVGGYVQARDALGRFTGADGSFRMSQEATAKVLLQNAKAVQALAKEQEQAAKAVTKAETDLQRRVDALTASYSPLTAAMEKTNKQLAEAKSLYDAGAISTDKYAQATQILTARLATQTKQHQEASAGAKLLGYEMLNLGRQTSDVFVQLATHQNPFLILVEQGPQIADVFQQAALRGVTLKSALAGIAAEVGPIIGIVAPLAAVAGVLALGTTRALENQAAVRAFTGELALNVDGLNYNAQALAATSKELSRYGLSAKDASAGLSTFVNAGVDADKLKAYSIAAKSLSEVSTQFKDVKSAQDAVAEAFTNGFSAVQKLDEKLNFLTVAQYEHIKAMFDAGKASEAQAEAFADFAARVDDAADKARGPWQSSVRDLSGAWSDFLDTLANSDMIQSTVKELSELMHFVQGTIKAVDDFNKQKRDSEGGYLNSVAAGRPKDASGFTVGGLGGPGIFQRMAWGENPLSVVLDPFDQTGGAIRSRQASALGSATAAMVSPKQSDADSPAAKAYLGIVGELNLELDRTKKINDAKRVELYAAEKMAAAATKGVRGDDLKEVGRIAGLVEQARIDKEREAQARRGDAAAKRANQFDARGDNAIEEARKAELAAQLATTKNVEALAGFKRDQIAQELEAQRVRLAGQVKTKEISQADAASAIDHYKVAAAFKQQALDLDTANQIANRDLQQRQEVLGYTQRVAQLQAAAAPTLEKSFAIQDKALADRQAYDRDALEEAVAQKVMSGEISLTRGKLLLVEQRIAQAAEGEDQQRQQRLAIFQRDLELAQAASANQVDILNSRKALAQSSYGAAQIERQILNATYDAERDRLSKIIANKDTDAKTLAESEGRLSTIEEIHRNELRQLELSDNAVTAYSDLVQALAGAARSVVDGDIGGSISAAGGVLKQLSGLSGSGALATAASYAGPIGAAVSAVTGVLGAIGDKSAAKAQAKLDALKKGVDDLRTSNMASSGSIEAALKQANANWNSDLEYTSAMLNSLRSIDTKIGATASLLARQITTGGLLDTSKLGLGTTSSSGGLGSGLLGGVAGVGLAGAAGVGAAAAFGASAAGLSWAAGAAALGPIGLVAGAVGALVGALTKTKTTTEVLDQGLQFAATTFGKLATGGLSGVNYADLVSTTKTSFLGIGLGTKVRNSTVTSGIDPALTNQISSVIEALGSGVVSAATVFGDAAGAAAQKGLEGATIDLGKLSLKGLSSDEIQKLLQSTFDKVADNLATSGVPGLDKLADAGEGAFSTLTRLAREYEVVDVSLKSIGKTFGMVGVESLAARDGLIKSFASMDDFVSETSFFASKFLTADQQLAIVKDSVGQGLTKLGVSADLTRDQFTKLVQAQDLTTGSGQAMYAALLAIAPAFDKVASASEQRASDILAKRTSIQDEIDKLTLSSSELTAKQRETERAAAVALDPSLGALIDKLYGLQDAASAAEAASKAAADAATAAADAEQKRAQALTAVGDSFANAMEAATKLSQSLQALANDLSNSLGQAGQAQSYESARAALMAAAGDKNGFNTNDANLEPLIKTFLDASKANSSTSGAYQADVAWARSLALIGSARQAAIPDAIVRMFRSFQEGATGFATGGSFTVGGAGAPDSQLFNLALSPGEMVNVTRPGTANDNDMSAVVAELKALRQQVADLQASNNRTATAAEKQESTLRNVTNGGSAMMTEAAS